MKKKQTDFVNVYTLGHASAGVLLGLAGVPWWGALLLGTTWEVVEHPIKDTYPKLLPTGQDSTLSSIGDVAGLMTGWMIGKLILQ